MRVSPCAVLFLFLLSLSPGVRAQGEGDDAFDDEDSNNQVQQSRESGRNQDSSCGRCVRDSVCHNGRCVCRPGYQGSGDFFCNNPNTFYTCESSYDPVMKTLGGQRYVYHFLGSTRLVWITTQKATGGLCHFHLWGWAVRYRGKFYYGGLSFRLDQDHPSGDTSVSKGHIDATVDSNGQYRWTITITGDDGSKSNQEDFTEGRSSSSADWGGCNAEIRRIDGNFLRITLYCCGIQFAIRQFNPYRPHAVPGFWFRVARYSQPSYGAWDNMRTEPLCLDHIRRVTVNDIIRNTSITIGRREALTFHAITNTPVTNYPRAPSNIGVLKSMFRGCEPEKRDQLFVWVRHFFNKPTLTSCLNGRSGNSEEQTILAILHAINYICSDSSDSCQPVVKKLKEAPCLRVVNKFPELASISRTSCEGGMNDMFENGEQ